MDCTFNTYNHRGRKGGAGGAEAPPLICTQDYVHNVNLCTLTINHNIIVSGDVTFCKINCYDKSTNRTECTFSILLNYKITYEVL